MGNKYLIVAINSINSLRMRSEYAKSQNSKFDVDVQKADSTLQHPIFCTRKFLGASTLDIVVDNSHIVFAVLFIAAFKPSPSTNYDSIHLTLAFLAYLIRFSTHVYICLTFLIKRYNSSSDRPHLISPLQCSICLHVVLFLGHKTNSVSIIYTFQQMIC